MKTHNKTTHTRTFQEDFGNFLRNSYGPRESYVILPVSFLIHSLVLYPNKTSSITADIEDKLVTFDFNDDILKIFIYVLGKLQILNQADIESRIMAQEDDPIVLSFLDEKPYVTGMVLKCRYGESTISATTKEQFTPLIIEEAKIAQEPAAVLLKRPVLGTA